MVFKILNFGIIIIIMSVIMVLVSSGYVIDIIAGEKITIIIMGYLV